MRSEDEPTQPGVRVTSDRARVSSISQLDQLSVLVGVLRTFPGVIIPDESEAKVKKEIKAYGNNMIDHGRMTAVTDIEGLRLERANLIAEVEDLRAGQRECQLAVVKYERGQMEWPELKHAVVGKK